MKNWKRIVGTFAVILTCAILAGFSMGFMQGVIGVEQGCGHCGGDGGWEEWGDSKRPSWEQCSMCFGQGTVFVDQASDPIYFIMFFMIYLVAIGIVTGDLKRFTVKIGPIFMMKQGGDTMRMKKDDTKNN